MIDSGRLFPYKTFDELSVQPEDVTVTLPSGKRLSAKARPAVAAQPNEYHLFADEDLSGWTNLHLGVRVKVQEDAVESLLPSGSKLQGNAVMLVAASCTSTKLRRRVFLTKDSDRRGEWYGEIDLSVNDLSDVVEFSPILARVTRYPEAATDAEGMPLAAYPGAVLAFGEAIRLFVDAPKNDRGGGFKVTWEDFSKSSNDWRRTHAAEMFFIDTSEEAPQVFLNSAHLMLQQTLMKKRPRGAEAAIKSSIIAYIAHTTWSTLFLAAIADCFSPDGDDDDVATWPGDAIKTKVLKKLLPLIVPERTDNDERLRLAVELYRDASRFGSLLTKLHSGIQTLIKIDDYVVKTLEATTDEES